MQENGKNKEPEDSILAIIDLIPDPVIVVDATGKVLAMNRLAEEYIGEEMDGIIGRKIVEMSFLAKTEKLLLIENLKKRLNGLTLSPYEIKVTRKNGEVALLEVKGKRIERDGNILDFVIFHDVTERSKHQTELQHELCKSEKRFKAISDAAFDGIILFDNQERIHYWNAAAKRIYGYDKREVLGKKLSKTIVPTQARASIAQFREDFAKGKLGRVNSIFEFPGLRKDGTEFPTEISVSCMKIDGKDFMVATIRDITERKNAEFAVKQEHAMLETVTDSVGVGLTVISKDYRILWSNDLLRKRFGDNLEQKVCFKRLHNRNSACPNCGVRKIFEGKDIDTREYSDIGKDGKLFAAQITVSPIRDKNGEIFAALEIAVPTTQRKHMEMKVKEAEKLYHALFEQSPLGVLVIDPETLAVVEFNDLAHRQLGYSRKEFSALRIPDFEALEDEDDVQARITRILNQDQDEFETKHRTKSGEIRNVIVSVRLIELSGKKFLLNTYHDITSIKRMQDALSSSEEKFHGIAHSIKDALILVDENAKVTYWNPAAENIFGYTNKEAIGKNIHALVVPHSMCREGKERIEASVKAFTETGIGYFTVGNVELVGRRKGNSEFPVELSISPINLGGKWCAVGVVKDITKRKQAERKLRDAEQRYHTLFNQAPLGVAVVDAETAAFVEFNDIAHLQLGYLREEFEKITIYDIEAKESKERVRAHLNDLVRDGGGEFETQHRTRNGTIKNVIVTVRTFQSDGKQFLHCIFHDITENKKAHNALVESEARYRQLVELAQEGIWALDNNFSTMFVNPRMAQMLGYKESEMTGKSLFDFLDNDVVEEAKQYLKQFNHQGVKGQFEYAFPCKDGSLINTSIAASAITDDQGQVIGTLALVADITKRKQLEDDLRSSEERFRTISTSARDAIILVDDEDEVVYWNPAAEKIFGFSEKEAVGNKLSKMVTPQYGQKRHAAVIRELSQNPTAKTQYEFMALKKNGTLFPIEVSLATMTLKEKRCIIAIVRDASERKAMEEALRQERDMLESMATNIDAGLTVIGKDYRVIWANQKLKQVNGGNRVESGYCYSAFNSASEGVCQGCGVRKIFENGASIDRHDFHFQRGDRDRWIELIATPVKDKDGKVVAALELAVDITERKRLQTKLAEYSQRLEEIVQKRTAELKKTQADLVKSERLAAIGELAGMIGHDLRNPLTGIKNSAYFMRKKGRNISEVQAGEMLEVIDKCVNYSNRVVNDLLDYSREIHLSLTEVPLKTLLTECLTMVNIPESIKVISKLSNEQHLAVDQDKITRVFTNLIKNAVDAMPNGGKITISSRQANGSLEVSFSDTGVGISEELLPKLFSPLFTTKAQGMGFGLAICKRMIEAHGGTITVKSAKGKGTTFTVNLPIEPKLESGGENIWISNPESSLLTTMKR